MEAKGETLHTNKVPKTNKAIYHVILESGIIGTDCAAVLGWWRGGGLGKKLPGVSWGSQVVGSESEIEGTALCFSAEKYCIPRGAINSLASGVQAGVSGMEFTYE